MVGIVIQASTPEGRIWLKIGLVRWTEIALLLTVIGLVGYGVHVVDRFYRTRSRQKEKGSDAAQIPDLYQYVYTEDQKLTVWDKASIVRGLDPKHWRRDEFGLLMAYWLYAERDSEHGWEMEYVLPHSRGGINAISNLRALNWRSKIRVISRRYQEEDEPMVDVGAFCKIRSGA